jgi:hypothetical protein
MKSVNCQQIQFSGLVPKPSMHGKGGDKKTMTGPAFRPVRGFKKHEFKNINFTA